MIKTGVVGCDWYLKMSRLCLCDISRSLSTLNCEGELICSIFE